MSNIVQASSAPAVPGRRAFLKGAAAVAALGGMAAMPGRPVAQPLQAAAPPLRPYTVEWSPDRLQVLRDRIRSFAFPRPIPGSGWRYGMDPDALRELVRHWSDGFDMEAAQRTLNRWPQVVTEVEGLDVHVVRVAGEDGPHKARLPLVLTHGWPGSTFEFWDAIEPLAFPSRSGAAGEPSFDLVIPSLPGFGPSGKPLRPIGARTTARLWATLMRNLGHERFYAQGGDWGAGVAGWLAIDHPDSVAAIHLNLMIAAPDAPPRTEAERRFARDAAAAEARFGAYYQLQATEPQSLAYAMADPVAQAAWLIQRFYHWSDRRTRPFEAVFTPDQLLTNVMIYVMNDAFQTSTWFYTGSQAEGVKTMPPGVRAAVPTGYAAYPGDGRSPNPPRSLVEAGYDLRRWAEVPHGGHFAAMEVPDLFVRDVRAWAKALDL